MLKLSYLYVCLCVCEMVKFAHFSFSLSLKSAPRVHVTILYSGIYIRVSRSAGMRYQTDRELAFNHNHYRIYNAHATRARMNFNYAQTELRHCRERSKTTCVYEVATLLGDGDSLTLVAFGGCVRVRVKCQRDAAQRRKVTKSDCVTFRMELI